MDARTRGWDGEGAWASPTEGPQVLQAPASWSLKDTHRDKEILKQGTDDHQHWGTHL